MYYAIDQKKLKSVSQVLFAYLIFSISLITFQLCAQAGKPEFSAEEYRFRGYEEQLKGNLDKALSYYIAAISLEGKHQHLLLNDIAVVYEQLGVLDKAEQFYLKAIELDPEYLPPYMNLAYFYQKEGNTVKAVDYFNKRVKLGDPEDIWTQKAKEELTRIYDQFPIFRKQMIKAQAAQLSEELVVKNRAEFLEKVHQSTQHYNEGVQLFEKGIYDKAVEEFDEALRLTPDHPKIIEARKQAMLEKTKMMVREQSTKAFEVLESGDSVAAKEEFRKVLTIIPDEPTQKSE